MRYIPAQYRKWFYIGLVLQIIAAYFSEGYHNHDEHFQILEFCNYKLGFTPASHLPWEFSANCRPALQPFIAYCFSKALLALHIYEPFLLSFLLRLSMGLLFFVVICRFTMLLVNEFSTTTGKNFFILSSLLLWFVPYLSVRFSAENFSGLLFFLAITYLLKLKNNQLNNRAAFLLLTGILFGFSLFSRLQMAFAFFGLATWLLFIQKWPWKELMIMIAGFVFSLGICVLIDYWFYGIWLITPYNYFDINIIQNVAARFGVSPWWDYFIQFFNKAIPPFSIVLLLLFFTGAIKKPLHLISLIAITFIIGHSLVGHKEIRFLYPVSIAFIFICSLGFDSLYKRYGERKYFRVSFRVLAVLNFAILAYRTLTPAQGAVNYYSYIYNNIGEHGNTIVSFSQDPYVARELTFDFYKPENGKVVILQQPAQLDSLFTVLKTESTLYIDYKAIPDAELPGYEMTRVYSLLPGWLSGFNYNNWMQRSNIWTIYELRKKH